MVASHCWLRFSFCKSAPEDGSAATWRIAELKRDPIWPLPEDPALADPEEFRLGMGRTLRGCLDVSSLSAVALTSWLAGDRVRFESVVAPRAVFSVKALNISARSATSAFDQRSKLLPLGNLVSFNSPMIDLEDQADGKVTRVLAHAHLFDATDDSSRGQPTAHFALCLTFSAAVSGELELSELVGDLIWVGEGSTPETEGLSFESPPLNSIYTRSLTFIKAWETLSEEGIESLTTDEVELSVPRNSKETEGLDDLVEYRKSLGTLGMLTVDSVRVTSKRFEAYVHEYGIETNQHGQPKMHAGIKLDFEQQRDGTALISKVFFDIEFVRTNRRSLSDAPKEVLTMAQEL
jgi:hypothetical protein